MLHDKTNRDTCQSGVQRYGIPSGHTPLEDLLQHTSIPWIEKQDIYCMWCQLCRWPTNKEKSTRTLDSLQQCSYHMEEQPTTDALSTTEAGLDSFVCCLRSVLHTMRILESMGDPHSMVSWWKQIRDSHSAIVICTNNMSPWNSRTRHVDSRITYKKETSRYIIYRQFSTFLTNLPNLYPLRPSCDV